MPKFKVHVFEEVRQTYEVEALNATDAVNKVISNIDEYRAVESEFTGDYSNDVCVDPILEDGTTDLENYQWLRISGDEA